MTDRHGAQYNLQSAMVSPAGNHSLVFWAGNPAPELERGERKAPHQFTAVEVVQARVGHEREDQASGSTGVVLFGYSDKRRCR